MDPAAFVRHNTMIAAAPLVPEIRLHLATEVTPISAAAARCSPSRSLARATGSAAGLSLPLSPRHDEDACAAARRAMPDDAKRSPFAGLAALKTRNPD